MIYYMNIIKHSRLEEVWDSNFTPKPVCWQVKDEEKYSINSIYPRGKSGLMYDCSREGKQNTIRIVKYTGLKVFPRARIQYATKNYVNYSDIFQNKKLSIIVCLWENISCPNISKQCRMMYSSVFSSARSFS